MSAYDLVNPGTNWSLRVRRLGEFHPALGQAQGVDVHDIDDPLYGNLGDAREVVGAGSCSCQCVNL